MVSSPVIQLLPFFSNGGKAERFPAFCEEWMDAERF